MDETPPSAQSIVRGLLSRRMSRSMLARRPVGFETLRRARRSPIFLDAEVFELELHVAAAIPFIDARMKHDRADGVEFQVLGLFGQVPADRLVVTIPLR